MRHDAELFRTAVCEGRNDEELFVGHRFADFVVKNAGGLSAIGAPHSR